MKRAIGNEKDYLEFPRRALLDRIGMRNTLISIGLRATKVKDDDLRWIKDFSRLERLDISQTAVTDASLPANQASLAA